MKTKKLKIYTLDEITDKLIGKPGMPKREAFEHELRLDLKGESSKQSSSEK
jgi:HTH-type transcriptional regulator / antitoxin HipB